MNKQQLAAAIWEAANKMRSKIEANEYKDYILGFMFYKFLSDNEEKYLLRHHYTAEDIRSLKSDSDIDELREGDDKEKAKEDIEEAQSDIDFCLNGIGYYIPYPYLFSTWIAKGREFYVSDVRDALSSFSRYIKPSHKKVFDKIFNTLETGLSKLGDSTGSQTKAVSDLIHLIERIPMDERQDYDVLGFIYEYLIGNFAANAGKKAGEFYTPHEVSLLMSEIVSEHLKDRGKISIYDPTSGSGSLLINIGKAIAKHNENKDAIKYYAQELKENTYNLTRMNLVMRGILPDNIVTRNGDTLEDDWPYFDEADPTRTYEPLYVDAVVSNPPYSQAWDPANKRFDKRFKEYGLAPKSKADYAFLLHDLFHLKDDGIMTIVLPHGVLFRGGEEGEIRKNLIEHNNIDTIIGLPANIFFGTGIPTIIMVLKKQRPTSDVLIIDASKGFEKSGKNNKLRACDIKRIVDVVADRMSISKFSRLVSRDEIRENDWNLNIPRYVDSSEQAETWDIYATMFGGIPDIEIDQYDAYWKAFPSLKAELFRSASGKYSLLVADDIKKTINENTDVREFRSKFNAACASFESFLKQELIDRMSFLNISKEETIISDNLFSAIEPILLVDKYDAYQAMDEEWTRIATDLEVIQTEGYQAVNKVDPRLVLKKKDGKDVEVQDGWIGHVLPFELVQKEYLPDELKMLSEADSRIQAIQGEYSEIIDSLSDSDKEDFLNDSDDAFVFAAVSAKLKDLNKSRELDPEEQELKEKLKKVDALSKEEKKLKSEIKSNTAALQSKTKETIERLTTEESLHLLELKWISSLIAKLQTVPLNLINDFIKQIQDLVSKYSETYESLSAKIEETSKALSSMIDDLVGDEFDMKGLEELKELLK